MTRFLRGEQKLISVSLSSGSLSSHRAAFAGGSPSPADRRIQGIGPRALWQQWWSPSSGGTKETTPLGRPLFELSEGDFSFASPTVLKIAAISITHREHSHLGTGRE
jgi:hypothetical protein